MEDLQSLLDKINRDGVEKAHHAADQIISDAKASAAAIIKSAKEDAERIEAASRQKADNFALRSEETIRQAARDTVLKIEASVTALFEKTLANGVDKALADEQTLVALVSEAIHGMVGSVEVAVNPKLVAALQAHLAAKKSVTVVTDNTLATGFSVRLDGGRVEHSFTGDAIAAELARRLRPDLAKLVG